ncbi:carbon storage regulator CsrA [Desulforhabdus amnigena]|jgi:carbon storage regulator|uniref:Translational regulator CsrA n=1 Tax=Desulforhabdus amnigena TaxID=40218 RepID=A0A9W6D1F4_9BACT|nr:carbon storage regulator CsrA [Deltaproteobacteria bacterium]GLI33523.1 carbon storage regulator [Desulforhabdus amnigena]
MLVLTRKSGESIRIGDDIEIVITEIDRKKVKIAIRSPKHIPIYRSELYEKMQQENREAAHMDANDLNDALSLFHPCKQPGPPENQES